MGKKIISCGLAAILIAGCHHFTAHTTSETKEEQEAGIAVKKPPRLVLLRGVGVYYSPESDEDLFFYGGSWYYTSDGYWYVSVSYKGPWEPILQELLPQALFDVPPEKFKHVPPGWEKVHGNET